MDKNQIKVISEISDFEYITREWIASKAKTKKKLLPESHNKKTLYRRDVVLVFYSPQDEYIELCIYWCRDEATKILGLNWESFNDDFLNEFASAFDLEVIINRDDNHYLIVKNYLNYSPTLSIKKSLITDNFFVAIYYFDDGESRKNPELYVHGIWEVTLSDDIKKKLFLV